MSLWIYKYGQNPDVDAGTSEDVWSAGGDYTGHPTGAAEAVTVVSDSADDTSASTGMRTCRLIGLGADWTTQHEDVTLSGTTPVTTAQTWRRLNRAQGLTGGSAEQNVGTVTIAGAITPANVYATIQQGSGQSLVAAYTVPIDQTGYLANWRVSVSNNASTSQELEAGVYIRPLDSGLWRGLNRQHASTTGGALIESYPGPGLQLMPGTDVKIRALTATANSLTVDASFDIRLEPGDVPGPWVPA